MTTGRPDNLNPPQQPTKTTTRRSIGVGTTGSDAKGTDVSISVMGDIELLVFRSVDTQTGAEPEASHTDKSATRVDRYPTSKMDTPLPESISTLTDEVLNSASPQDLHSTQDVSVQGAVLPDGDGTDPVVARLTGTVGQGDLRWLKWASDGRSPALQTFVSSILSGSRKSKSDFLKVDTLELPKKFSDSWFVPVRLGDKSYHFLCDTGSAATIIRPEVYKRLPFVHKTPLVSPGFTLRNASAGGVSVSGLCCLELELGTDTFPCRVVVADVNCAGILGQNFLEHYGCVLDMARGSLQLPHGTLFMAKGNKPSVCRVHASRDVCVPGHSQVVLSCHVRRHCKMTCSVGVVEPLRKTVNRYGILVGRCLVNSGPQVPVLILNPGKAAVTVPAGGFIALVKPIGYLDDQEEETFLPGVGPRLPNPPVETAAQSHPFVDVVCSPTQEDARSPPGLHPCTSTGSIEPLETESSASSSSCMPVHSSVSSMAIGSRDVPDGFVSPWDDESGTHHSSLRAPRRSDSPHGSCSGSGAQPVSLGMEKRSETSRVHSSVSPIGSVEDRRSRTENWVETHRLTPSLDVAVDVETQRTGPEEIPGSDSLPTREPGGEPFISVRLPTANSHLYLQAATNPGQVHFARNVSVTHHKPSSVDTDESSRLRSISSSSDSFVPDRRSSIIGVDSSESSSEDETPVRLDSIVARWTHPLSGRIYIPEHLLNLIPRDLPPQEQFQLAETLSRYKDIFVGPNGSLGRTGMVKHDILTGDSRPIKHAPRRMGPHQNEIISQELDKMLKAGIFPPLIVHGLHRLY